MAESVELRTHVWEVGISVPDWVKPMTYKIGICRSLALCSASIGRRKHRLAQCQDNMTEWDIESWYQWSVFPVGQHYKVSMSVHCHKSDPSWYGDRYCKGRKTPTTTTAAWLCLVCLCLCHYGWKTRASAVTTYTTLETCAVPIRPPRRPTSYIYLDNLQKLKPIGPTKSNTDHQKSTKINKD